MGTERQKKEERPEKKSEKVFRPGFIETRTEAQKRIILWTGIIIVMAAIIIAWGFFLKSGFFSKNRENDSFGGLGEKFGEFGKNMGQLKEEFKESVAPPSDLPAESAEGETPGAEKVFPGEGETSGQEGEQ